MQNQEQRNAELGVREEDLGIFCSWLFGKKEAFRQQRRCMHSAASAVSTKEEGNKQGEEGLEGQKRSIKPEILIKYLKKEILSKYLKKKKRKIKDCSI